MNNHKHHDAMRENVIAAVRDLLSAENTAAVRLNIPGAPSQTILAGDVRSVARLLELDTIEDNGAARIAELEAENARLRPEVEALRTERENLWKSHFLVSKALHNVIAGNQAAWLEWDRGQGAEAAMEWVHNGLVGPGLIPDAAEGIGAQAWFDAKHDDRFDAPPLPGLDPAAPVSASPQQAAPAELTDDEILTLDCLRLTQSDDGTEHAVASSSVIEFARAVLAAFHQAAAGAEGADGWRTNTGVQPVANEVRVDVEFRNGTIAPNVKAAEWAWQVGDEFMERKWVISRWRLAAPSTSQPAREG
ncbi:hypothetical protein IP92_04907 [Pseudoduganella flava]|uniref:Uncharacterized protein n=1 Tax=Pseudoduganella flava TaxID=871742 RepID=A0A562PHA2_9BURK|nr:hypothetical protein [Pseudoduganella flava]QGZ42686.1 hypothetical protein GO485_29075 [Pseudoduganella flava]TWI43852.1 hypothetical protein IP92_04907 [Pseudoduganella flava]